MMSLSSLFIAALLASSALANDAMETRTLAVTPFAPVLINCGGSAYVDSFGRQWSEDKYFSGGYTFQSTIPVANTLDDTLYNCERYGQTTYSIPAPTGSYTVVLHFAEIYHDKANMRVFDIDVEGQTIADFDIVKQGRSVAFKAIKRTINPVSVWDGFLTIKFFDNMPLIDFPKISAIEVFQVAATPTAPKPIAPVAVVTKAPVVVPVPTKAPVIVPVPTKAPVKAPVVLSTKAPVKVPVVLSTKAPVKVPVVLSTKAPVKVPVVLSTKAPVKVPVVHSTKAPITAPVATLAPILINCGSKVPYFDSMGRMWRPDAFFTGGFTYESNVAISNTVDDSLYNCERYGHATYSVPVPAGSYTLVLHFAEIYYVSVGSRVFDVCVENIDVPDVDIVKLGGGSAFTAVTTIMKNLIVTDGFLTIDFKDNKPQIDFPKISAIEIVQEISLAPVAPPTVIVSKAPVVAITNAPVAVITKAPVVVVTKAPVVIVTKAPVKAPVAPIPVPKAPVVLAPVPIAPKPSPFVSKAPVIVRPAFTPVRINCGGVAYTDAKGRVWSSDKYFTGGYAFGSSLAIADTEDDSLYNCERYGQTTYQVPVPTGAYNVVLHFAEIYYTEKGKRIFDVTVETNRLEDFDIVQIGGGLAFKAISRYIPYVMVTDGFLTIQLHDNAPLVGFPKISAIEIYPSNMSPIPAPKTPVAVAVTKAPVVRTKSPAAFTKAPVVRTKAPAAATKSPVVLTKAPVVITNAPVVATKSPVATTKAPVVTTKAPAFSTKAPVVKTKAPVARTNAPIVKTKSPIKSPPVPSPVAPRASPAFSPILVNCGGGAYVDTRGRTWLPDQFFVGGRTYDSDVNIGNTEDDALFNCERYGQSTYQIPVPIGKYNVTLHFAEIYYTAVGSRVFDVRVEASTRADVDIVKLGGGVSFQAVALQFTAVMVSDGRLSIDFIDNAPLIEFPKISAIEVNAMPF